LSAIVVVLALGSLTHWRSELIAVYVFAFPVSLVLLVRLFYGFRAARRVDMEAISPGSGWSRYDDLGGMPRRLVDAYEKAQAGDPSEFEHLVEEEQSSEPRPEVDSTHT
jgi:hypothetical protein